MVVSGALCDSWAGWPSVFFVTGGIGILWGFLWFPLISDSPPTDGRGGTVPDDNKSLLSVPWRSILSSPAFLSLVLTHACANWGFYCLLTEMPSYLGHVLHFDVYTNGLVSSLPYLTKWLVMVSFSFWIDRSMERGRFSLRTSRRMASLIGLVTPALLLASIQLGGCSKIVVVLLLCLAVGISGTDSSGFLCAYQELAPNYAGVLAGLGNTVATLPGFLAPQLTGYLTEDQQSRSSWRQVFLVASALYLLSAAVYLTFMSTKVQPWNDPSHGRKEDSEQACPLSDVNTDANA
uniref:Sialin-like n=1 Tax=Hirondellea gigas TaxID=1518452 RepID=A0A6A7G436_9CRUS